MNKFLIVRLGALGDLIHTLPTAAALRRAYPQARIDWLVDVKHRELLDLVPIIDRRIAIRTSSLPSTTAAVELLFNAHYDAALDLQGLIKSAMLAKLSFAGRVIGFPKPLLRERAASMFYGEEAGTDAAHVIHKNLSMLKAVGVSQLLPIEFPIEDRKPEAVAAVQQRLGIGSSDRFAIINPGAAWPNKRWPPVYFAEVAATIRKRFGLPSIVLWGPGEQQLAQDVVDAASGAAAVSPETTLADLVSIAKAASIMISGDTGPIHVAGAMGTPLVGIYGPTDPGRNGPWASRDLTVSRFDQCQCHYQRQCHEKRWCLLDISPRDVVSLVEQRLAQA